MNKKQTLTDDEKYMQTQGQLERELIILRRQFASLDLSRYTQKQGKQYITINRVINLYQKENQNIRIDLHRATSTGRRKEDLKYFDYLSQLLDELTVLEKDSNEDKLYIKEIEIEIKEVKKSVQQLQKQKITDKQHEDHVVNVKKTLEALENKLEAQMIKFGTICTQNQKLRLEIDHLLCDRRNFIGHWTKFIRKLSHGKKIMMDLIEQATVAFNQREEWCNKLQCLRTKAHQDFVLNMQEMREYKRKHDNSVKIEQFLEVKGQKRIMADFQKKMEEKSIKQRQILEEKLEHYQDMLSTIQNFTKEANIIFIAKHYINQEEHNLSNFRYIVDAVGDMDIMNEQLGPLHLDIEERNILYNSRNEQQKTTIRKLEEKFEDVGVEANMAETNLKTVSSNLETLLQGVDKLFNLCNCKKDPILRLLGSQESVQNHNVLLYIEVLEAAIHRLLIMNNFNKKNSGDKRKHSVVVTEIKPKIFPIDEIVQKTPCALCVEHEMVGDVVDTLQIVLPRDKVKDKLKFKLKYAKEVSRVHNLSECQLPKSRGMLQKRYE